MNTNGCFPPFVCFPSFCLVLGPWRSRARHGAKESVQAPKSKHRPWWSHGMRLRSLSNLVVAGVPLFLILWSVFFKSCFSSLWIEGLPRLLFLPAPCRAWSPSMVFCEDEDCLESGGTESQENWLVISKSLSATAVPSMFVCSVFLCVCRVPCLCSCVFAFLSACTRGTKSE